MTSSGTIHVKAGYSWTAILLFTFVLSLLTTAPAEDSCEQHGCSKEHTR